MIYHVRENYVCFQLLMNVCISECCENEKSKKISFLISSQCCFEKIMIIKRRIKQPRSKTRDKVITLGATLPSTRKKLLF